MNKYNIIQAVYLIAILAFVVVLLGKWWGYQEQQIMSVDYCWDENGQHYVAPDYRCQ